MHLILRRFILPVILFLSTLLTIDGCHNFFIIPLNATSITFKGPLTVALQQDLITKSLEKDLISNFAKTRGIQIQFVAFETVDQALELLKNEKVDLVFPRTPLLRTEFHGHHTMVYDDLRLSVVCSSTIEAANKLYIPENYLYAVKNKKFNSIFQHLHWIESSKTARELEKNILANPGYCFLTDTRLATKTSLYYPQLQKVWTSTQSEAVAWITRTDLTELNQLIHLWFQNLVREKKIRKFWDRYESVDFKMSVLGQNRFQKDIIKQLPKWHKLFEKNAKKNEMPWTLLAAVAYQESKWNQDAISYTGVKGLMQLTRTTAQQIGVDDREDPKESIRGGAFYLKYLYDKTSPELIPFERWAQVLVAYNMGWAHLRDARRLAKKMNLDINRWVQFKKVLPLLNDKSYLPELTFGPARGFETILFVEQVLGYTELLNGTFTRRLPTSQDF